jgi:GntR family transcriptional regulator/MocR family aminotransferase
MIEASRQPELFVVIDRDSSESLRTQLGVELRNAIKDGRLRADETLPSSRRLAVDLGVSRGVVSDAYSQLAAEGYLEQSQGALPRVRRLPEPNPQGHVGRSATPRRHELVGTVPDLGLFPRREWLAALRQAMREIPDAELNYGDRRGTDRLRQTLAAYLGRVRGVSTTAETILVTHGYTQALSLVCRVLARGGARRVGVENPSDDDQWDVIRRAGLELVACPVDEHGIDVATVAAEDVDAVVVTPAHQFPTGTVLVPERRAELAAWADGNNRLIIEDDYDSAYRYDRDPVGTLQGLVPGNCVHIGSVSKLLAPSLRIGWAVVPGRLMTELTLERWATDAGHRAIDQYAFAEFIANGSLDRHLRRSRQVYRRRQLELVDRLKQGISGASIEGIAAGLHFVLRLPDATRETEVVQRLNEGGIYVRGLASYQLKPARIGPGLVLGYGGLADGAISSVVEQIATAVREAS